MCLQILLSNKVSDVGYSKRFKMDIPNSRTKMVDHSAESLVKYTESVTGYEHILEIKMHIDNVVDSLREGLSRMYHQLNKPVQSTVANITVYTDNMNDVEKSSLRGEGNPCMVLSMENCLDIVLQYLTGTPAYKIRKRLEHYEDISLAIMNCAVHKYLPDFDINCFLGIDSRLDDYIFKMVTAVPDDGCSKDEELIYNFYYDVLSTATMFLNLATSRLLEECSIGVRSQSFSNFVFSYTQNTNRDLLPEKIQFVLREKAKPINYDATECSFEIPLIRCESSGYLGYLMDKYDLHEDVSRLTK